MFPRNDTVLYIFCDECQGYCLRYVHAVHSLDRQSVILHLRKKCECERQFTSTHVPLS